MNKQQTLKQYFTPTEVADFMVENSAITAESKVIDPSVGAGVFLEALRRKEFGEFYGVDVDDEIISRNRRKYRNRKIKHFAADVLDAAAAPLKNGYFDIAIGNPPFSNQKNKVADFRILKNYCLAKEKQSIEILFLERFLQLVREGGSIRIILPINIFSNTNLQYVRNFIIHNMRIEAIVSLPRNTFPNTSAKTAILFARKTAEPNLNFFGEKPGGSVKLLAVEKKADLTSLKTVSIYDGKTGVWKELENIQLRMDPDYHYAENATAHYLSGATRFRKLSEIANIYNGFTKYGEDKAKIYESVGRAGPDSVRLLKAKNVNILGLKLNENRYFIKKEEDIYKREACVEVGDVIVVRVGAGCAGRAACIINDKHKGQVDDWIFILRDIKVNPNFLSFYLNSSVGKTFVSKEKQGTGTISISKNKLAKVLVPIIPEEDQEYFDSLVRAMYSEFERNRVEKARSLFAAMDEKLTSIIMQSRRR